MDALSLKFKRDCLQHVPLDLVARSYYQLKYTRPSYELIARASGAQYVVCLSDKNKNNNTRRNESDIVVRLKVNCLISQINVKLEDNWNVVIRHYLEQ